MVYTIELLARQGIKQIIVSLHHMAGDIEAYFGDGRRWGVKLEYVLQRDAWGTGGALKWSGSLLADTFIFLPADSLLELDLTCAINQHDAHQTLASVIVHRDGADQSHAISLDSASFIRDVSATSSDHKMWYDTGIYIFEPKVLDYIPQRTHFDIHTQLLPALLARDLPIFGCKMEGYWNELDTFPKYHQGQRAILYNNWEKPAASGVISSVRYPLLQGREVARGIWVGRNNRIHPTVRLSPPVCIGDNCWIGREVELGPETFIGSNVIVDSEATISQSTVLDHTYVGMLVNIENRLVNNGSVIDLATGNQLQVVDPYLLGRTNQLGVRSGLKRIFDFTMALLLVVIFLPLFIALALLLLITEHNVFDRVYHLKPGKEFPGSPRQSFNLIRFHIPAKGNSHKLLRYCLDHLEWYRLPELWNVIKGDIGLVGVKPKSAEEVADIAEAWRQKPYDYSPGFTGLWYVATEPDSKPDDIVIADAYYTATRTWQVDLQLLSRTPLAWIKRVRKQGNL
jgi:NDP-sugar pyrophosphorylase family protein